MILLTAMYSTLIVVSGFIAYLVIDKYLQSYYNHVENLWYGLAFIVLAFTHFVDLIEVYKGESVQNTSILSLYAYWVMLIMAFRLRQIQNNWSYFTNKKIKLIILMLTVFSLYLFHELESTTYQNTFFSIYTYILILLSLAMFIVIPGKGYYIFFKIGYAFLTLSYILCLFRNSVIYYTPHILEFSGFISIGIAIYFIFYSDKLLERRGTQPPRRREDQVI